MMFDVVQYVMLIGTFLVAAFILYKVLWNPLVASLDERQAKIDGDIAKARQEREEMERLRNDYEQKLRDAHAKVDEMIREATQSANATREELVKKAKEEAQGLLRKAEAKLSEDRTKVLREIRTEVVDLAISAAERVIQQTLDKNVQKKLVESFLQETKR